MLMRKIHPGFIAIAILLGPATLILAHEKITRTPAQEVFESVRSATDLATGLYAVR